MVRRAQENALRNNIGNVRFRQADLSDTNAVADIDMRGITKLLLDPPRTGADEIVKRLDLEGLDRIVYVSCNPVTLARDAKSIRSKSGLKLVCAGVLDMFPHTSHVESIAVFEKS
jgi:23S rRNA (uracil1939-C5)-methyltransferase